MIPGSANPLLLATAAPTGYNIERCIRLNSADSAYLSRTPASAGNQTTMTFSFWMKLGRLGISRKIITGGSSTWNDGVIQISSSDKLELILNNGAYELARLTSTRVFRDPSAWYHVVINYDSTNATSTERWRMYVNNERITVFDSASYPGLSGVWRGVNSTATQFIGTGWNGLPFDGYLADIHFIDGQALTPSSFGEFDVNNVWQPKAYTGSYGTNGFKLNFSNNSAATAAALGADSSGNGHNWTPTNLSVTAGAGNDSLVDVPTNGTEVDTGAGGQVRGNYATLNPLLANATLANGNLDISGGVPDFWRHSTIGCSSGKWYAEMTVGSSSSLGLGIYSQSALNSSVNASQSRGYFINGQKYSNGSLSTYGNSFTTNDVIGIAFDVDAGKVWFSKNGTWQASGDPVAGTNAAFTDIANNTWFVTIQGATFSASANFGQRPFAYTAPSGFKALCTANLPTPTIANGATAMDVALWTGTSTGSTSQTISGLAFSPDLVWLKNRTNGGAFHVLNDTNRGANRRLSSNSTAAEEQNSLFGYLSAFTSDGFTLTPGTSGPDLVCQNGVPYVAWTWDAGSSTVTNTSGTISSQVRANPSAGFSVVTFTMGSGSYTVGHGLGVAPSLLITKARSNTSSWWTYHRSLGTGSYLALNTTAAAATDYSWGTAPTSTVFTANNNFFTNTYTYVVYAFAPVVGYSAFGSYTGNGSADGPFVYTGFRPRWLLVKNITTAYGWALHDTSRYTYNEDESLLYANSSVAESTNAGFGIDILSNGFKIRCTSAATVWNETNSVYIYAAFAEHPFSASRAR